MTMRRVLALPLLLVFSWMLIAPAFGPDADANLPACCRRGGKHHCTMHRMGQIGGSQKGFTSVSEKCPYCPASTCAVAPVTYKPETGNALYIKLVSMPARASRTKVLYRISLFRSHQKRGPPNLFV
jgi:hypothetical protein